MKTKLIGMVLISICAFTACESDDDDTTPTPSDDSGNNSNQTFEPSISFSGADATLIAVQSVSSTIAGNFTIGTAVGVFYDNGVLIDAGTVSAEGTDLTLNANNSYTATASASNPTGINYTTPIEWSVSGNNGFAAFTESVNRSFPTADAITSGETIDKSDGYTLSTSSITGSDSVLFTIGNVSKIMSANTTSYTFSSQELSVLSNGTNVASIAPYNFSNKTISSKNIYFVNEYVVQRSVSIQN